jgi:hypothetical protein
MEKREPKPKVTDVVCPNESCTYHLIIGKGNVMGNGTYQLDAKRIRRYFCRSCDHTNTEPIPKHYLIRFATKL